MIDLHCHSSFSDGILSPKALLDLALKVGIHTLALTDHDTIAGVKTLTDLAQPHPIQIIPGIELSVKWKKYDIHILGLHLDIQSAALHALIEKQTAQRIQRAQEIGAALDRCGLENSYQQACDYAGHDRIGRVHYAQVLLKAGYVREARAAFTQYLGKGKVAYVPTSWINLEEAVSTIKAANGLAVIAHPLKYGLTRTKLHELIHDFKAFGGKGIEVVSGDMMDQDIQRMARLCYVFDLLASSGSDFHGEGISRLGLGRQKSLPTECTPVWQNWASTPLVI